MGRGWVVALVLVVAAACGRSGGAGAAVKVPDDPCALLPVAEASEIVGVPLHESPMGPRSKDRPVQSCFYMGMPDLQHAVAGRELHPPNLVLRVISAKGATKVVAAEQVHPPEITSVDPVAGVGDRAVLVNGGMVVAAVHGVRIELSAVDGAGPSGPKAIEAAKRVASRIT